ncbi:hypothetical protein [Burkholderia gladioli]|uniref:hypothetical protein n=1 Tax=Burkholderia gladioli TaxID=28095 RepID=UPI00163FD467|nr:hypothetical protein [Burkholderia gladioli]
MGIREEYERRRGEYIEYGQAVAMLAKAENIMFSEAANWLLEREVHRAIPCFIRKNLKKPDVIGDDVEVNGGELLFEELVPHLPSYDDPSFTNGPLDILWAIVKGDNIWWEWVGYMQKMVDKNQRWRRDDFWKFVIDHGASVPVEIFETSSECPTFLLDELFGRRKGELVPNKNSSQEGMASSEKKIARVGADVDVEIGEGPSYFQEGTILEKIGKKNFPRKLLDDALNNFAARYIARVILESEEISRRSKQDWAYKQLAQLAEEKFVNESSGFWGDVAGDLNSLGAAFSGEKGRSWYMYALQEIIQYAQVRVWNELEGLSLYLEISPGEFRPAEPGDGVYDFVCRLRDDGMLLGDNRTAIDLPNWTRELYVNRANWDAFNLVWSSGLSLSDPNYKDFIEGKKSLVRMETERRSRLVVGEWVHRDVRGLFNAGSALYPQELAIAAAAWVDVTSNGQSAPEGVAAKAAITNWLNANYPGLPEGARDRISTVANWNKKGGATRTPE